MSRGRPANDPGQRVSGSTIQRRRKARGLTMVALAALVGVSEGTVYNWEREIRRPTRDQLAALARALQVKPRSLAR